MRTPVIVALLALASAPPAAAAQPPNVVLILIDDLGWRDLGSYGSTFYETPHVDRLARQGTRFTQAYAAAPVCSPTRASLLTGRSPARLGFTGHITSILEYRHPPNARILPPEDHGRLRKQELTIAEAIAPNGYTSASIGKWHLGPREVWPEQQGFDLNLGGNTHGSPPSYFDPYENPSRRWSPSLVTLPSRKEGEYLTDRLTDEAIQFVERNREGPFFLYLSHYAVHTPLQAPERLVEKYRRKLQRDDSQKNPVYAAMIESVDTNVGRLLDALDRLELTDDTLVVFFSDNGGLSRVTNNAPLRGGKQTLYEGGRRVPLIVKWPGRVRAGAVCDTPVISHDLFPTIVEFAGFSPDALQPLDGRSLVPLLTRKGDFPERTLHWYYPQYARRPGYVVRDGRYSLVEHYDPPSVELFDLKRDLGETTNLAEKMPARVRAMQQSHQRWLEDVGAITHTPNPSER